MSIKIIVGEKVWVSLSAIIYRSEGIWNDVLYQGVITKVTPSYISVELKSGKTYRFLNNHDARYISADLKNEYYANPNSIKIKKASRLIFEPHKYEEALNCKEVLVGVGLKVKELLEKEDDVTYEETKVYKDFAIKNGIEFRFIKVNYEQ